MRPLLGLTASRRKLTESGARTHRERRGTILMNPQIVIEWTLALLLVLAVPMMIRLVFLFWTNEK